MTTETIRVPDLRNFFNDMGYLGISQEVSSLWTYYERAVNDVTYQELRLVGNSVIIQQASDQFGLSVLALQTNELRVYEHAAFMLAQALPYFVRGSSVLHLHFLGTGYQAFIGLDLSLLGLQAELIKLEGSLELVNRHGVPYDKEISKVTGALVKVKGK